MTATSIWFIVIVSFIFVCATVIIAKQTQGDTKLPWWRWMTGELRQAGQEFCEKETNLHPDVISSDCCKTVVHFLVNGREQFYPYLLGVFAFGALVALIVFKCGEIKTPTPPGYWQHPPRLFGLGRLNPFSDHYNEEVDVTNEPCSGSSILGNFSATTTMGEAVQRLLDLKTKGMGPPGFDSFWQKHKGFEVVQVTRIENGRLWSSYSKHRANVQNPTQAERYMRRFSASDQMEKLQKVEKIIAGHNNELKHDDHVKRFVGSLGLQKDKNEVLLFHGSMDVGAMNPLDRKNPTEIKYPRGQTSPVEAIKSQGLDDRVGATGGMLGIGTYLADWASKADCYAGKYSEGESTVGEEAVMFLSRVALGTPYLAEQSLQGLRRPPSILGNFDWNLRGTPVMWGFPWDEKRLTMKLCDAPRYDSVISSRKMIQEPKPEGGMSDGYKKYNEYVIYGKQSYPEFCVRYRRTGPLGD